MGLKTAGVKRRIKNKSNYPNAAGGKAASQGIGEGLGATACKANAGGYGQARCACAGTDAPVRTHFHTPEVHACPKNLTPYFLFSLHSS